ncbi:MAG: hypothetical protein HWE10_03975 [Gammaproteobacteria bacterium]|nr:hypothetical protein [Gammaproteobacteria bacterium]
MRARFRKTLTKPKKLFDSSRRRMARKAVKKRLVQRRLKQIPICLDHGEPLTDTQEL